MENGGCALLFAAVHGEVGRVIDMVRVVCI